MTRLALAVALLLLSAGSAAAQTDLTIDRFFLPGTSTTGYRVHANTSEMHVTVPSGKIRAAGGYKTPVVFSHASNVVAGLSNQAIPLATTGVTYLRPVTAGSIIGVSIGARAALDVGAAHAEATILRDGSVVATGLIAVIRDSSWSGAQNQFSANSQARDLSQFTTSEAIGCRITTDSTAANQGEGTLQNPGFRPLTNEFVCTVTIEQ